ncbi:MAG: tRNA (adenosine(37)-N6)-threonylcarbamoyltransferase complex transferase subunit TsaD [Lentisphaerae bacterium]|nr:tRNA (adenosine(37)-N6)-threonylcarbamoyltransferase complex transferase subunit TsaD [Lentisphaerota bacterium]MCP4101919.1 tRNA (adenosine(37)-N6)-threonylcarbamoyltransferase complex transferase subunit TsaD [Lentisphaerota bacterium]
MSLILGIESSCDETAAAVVKDGSDVLGACVASQIARHAEHGGVVPELAAREHLKAARPVLEGALSQAGVTLKDIDAIAVTQGPGLIPALLVGLNLAKGLAVGNDLPLIGINHFIAHIYASFLDGGKEELEKVETYPILALVVSGGHTALLLIDEAGQAKLVGTTIDDAAGEALDKASKMLGLGYPGGPIIQKTAESGDASKYHFPRPLTGAAGKAVAPEHKYNFSFSGVKTALLYHVQKLTGKNGTLEGQELYDTVASYQEAVVDVLCRKTALAAKDFNARTVVLCGGVACNSVLRERMGTSLPQGAKLRLAERKYCTDNAAMVGGLAHYYFEKGQFTQLDADSYARLPSIADVPFVKFKDVEA